MIIWYNLFYRGHHTSQLSCFVRLHEGYGYNRRSQQTFHTSWSITGGVNRIVWQQFNSLYFYYSIFIFFLLRNSSRIMPIRNRYKLNGWATSIKWLFIQPFATYNTMYRMKNISTKIRWSDHFGLNKRRWERIYRLFTQAKTDRMWKSCFKVLKMTDKNRREENKETKDRRLAVIVKQQGGVCPRPCHCAHRII